MEGGRRGAVTRPWAPGLAQPNFSGCHERPDYPITFATTLPSWFVRRVSKPLNL